jgi:hypothetical protein
MTIEQLDRRMSSAEFTRWVAYAGLEPFGYPIEMYRMGLPASSLVNAIYATIPVPKGKARPKQLRPADFYPQQKKSEPELTPELQEALRKKRAKRK